MKAVRLALALAIGPLAISGCAIGSSAIPAAPSVPVREGTPSRSVLAAKIDSILLQAVDRISAGEPLPERAVLDLDAAGRVLVDVTARVTVDLLRQIGAFNGVVVSELAQYDAIRAWVPIGQLLTLAAHADVTSPFSMRTPRIPPKSCLNWCSRSSTETPTS